MLCWGFALAHCYSLHTAHGDFDLSQEDAGNHVVWQTYCSSNHVSSSQIPPKLDSHLIIFQKCEVRVIISPESS